MKKTIHFEFSQDLVRQPLLHELNSEFNIVINIRAASVNETGGFIALELDGEEPELEKVLRRLSERGIEVIEGLGETAG